MLTLILLVVLGGGAGLMAVWLIDARGLSQLFGRFEWRSLRPTRRSSTTGPEPVAPDARPRDARFQPLVPTATDPRPAAPLPMSDPPTTVTYERVEVPPEPLPVRSSTGRRDGKRVPAAYTAIEGSYRDVARVPAWRKLISLLSLLGILLVAGVAVAALAGATFGVIAELVDGAIG